MRILHAIGFEGGLLIATVPMIAYMMQMTVIDAFILDIGLTLCILVYTFIFQWCYDYIEDKFSQMLKQHHFTNSHRLNEISTQMGAYFFGR